ncbi:MAG: hypothetical protein R3B96_16955 [Pirellulaceae bacterium]
MLEAEELLVALLDNPSPTIRAEAMLTLIGMLDTSGFSGQARVLAAEMAQDLWESRCLTVVTREPLEPSC